MKFYFRENYIFDNYSVLNKNIFKTIKQKMIKN